MINLHINCPNIRDIPNNQIPLQKVGDYRGFDTRSVTVQYMETVAILKVSSEVIKCPTIGVASFGQSPYVARLLPVRGVVGHNIDRCITSSFCVVPESSYSSNAAISTLVAVWSSNCSIAASSTVSVVASFKIFWRRLQKLAVVQVSLTSCGLLLCSP